MGKQNKDAPFLSVADIAAVDDLKTSEIYIHEWSGKVRIRVLSGELRPQIEDVTTTEMKAIEAYEKFIIKLVTLATVDEDGKQLFSDSDIAMLKKKNPNAITKIFNEAVKLNALSAQDVEEIVKK